MDFQANNAKLLKLQFDENNEDVTRRVRKANNKLIFSNVCFWGFALAIVIYYAIDCSGIAKWILFGIAALIVAGMAVSFLPHKVAVYDEVLELISVNKVKSAWFGTVKVTEIDDTIDVLIYAPNSFNSTNKNTPPLEAGTTVKIIRIGKVFYIAPSSFVDKD